ncbi:hypothetical protein, partial [Clavibacter michiganensis]|uniref:hypothetical protein n=1 Tax=Clavibacter michiganensis TaxID=28447 RepID=UPI002931E1F1
DWTVHPPPAPSLVLVSPAPLPFLSGAFFFLSFLLGAFLPALALLFFGRSSFSPLSFPLSPRGPALPAPPPAAFPAGWWRRAGAYAGCPAPVRSSTVRPPGLAPRSPSSANADC